MRAPEFGTAFARDAGTPRVSLPARSRVQRGDRVRLEVSFGPLADEVDLFGIVAESSDDASQLELDDACAAQLAYVLDVLGGQRQAAARRHRRLASSLPVRWSLAAGGASVAPSPSASSPAPYESGTGMDIPRMPPRESSGPQASRGSQLADISSGGAFIVSTLLPQVGDLVVVQLRSGDVLAPLRVESEVTWVRDVQGPRRGFGVAFRPQDPTLAKRLQALVRAHEDR